MSASLVLSQEGHRLLQIGVALLLFSSFWGFVVPYARVPRLGLSVHTLSAFEALVLLALGLLWPVLHLSALTSAAALWLFVYSALATLASYLLAAVWGAGNSTIPLAAGTARGTPFQEAVIKVVLYSAAPTVIVSLALILWGLRG